MKTNTNTRKKILEFHRSFYWFLQLVTWYRSHRWPDSSNMHLSWKHYCIFYDDYHALLTSSQVHWAPGFECPVSVHHGLRCAEFGAARFQHTTSWEKGQKRCNKRCLADDVLTETKAPRWNDFIFLWMCRRWIPIKVITCL